MSSHQHRAADRRHHDRQQREGRQHDNAGKDRHRDARLARLRHRFGRMLEQQQVMIAPEQSDRLHRAADQQVSPGSNLYVGHGGARHAALALHAEHRNPELRSQPRKLDGAPGITRPGRDHRLGKMVVRAGGRVLGGVLGRSFIGVQSRATPATAPWKRPVVFRSPPACRRADSVRSSNGGRTGMSRRCSSPQVRSPRPRKHAALAVMPTKG